MLSYHDFVIERHKIWEKRLLGLPAPWTDDPIMASNSFTNVFRVLDYGSQYLLQMLQHQWDLKEVLFRAALYRFTNRPEPWEYFHAAVEGWPTIEDYTDGTLHKVWSEYTSELRGSAYQITVGLENKGLTYLDYLTTRFIPELLSVADEFCEAGSLEQRVQVLQRIPRCGPFLSMQINADVCYVDPTFSLNDYILPGPGAVKGVTLLDDGDPAVIIRQMRDYWATEGTVTLAGVSPNLTDVGSHFCEYQKYHRWSQANQIGKYVPKHLNEPDPFIPRHMKAARP